MMNTTAVQIPSKSSVMLGERNKGLSQSLPADGGNRSGRSLGTTSTTSSGDDNSTLKRSRTSSSRRKKRNNGSSSRRRAGSSSPVDLARVGFDGRISHSRSHQSLVQLGTPATISSYGIDDKSSSGIGNNRRRNIGSSSRKQVRNIGLSQSDHNNTGTSRTAGTTATTTASLQTEIVFLKESNASLLDRVSSLEGQLSSLLARVLTLEGEKSKIGTDSSITESSEANTTTTTNTNTNTNTSDAISVIEDSTTGLPNNIQKKNNERKEKKMSMKKKKNNTSTTNNNSTSNNHDDTKKKERKSLSKTANNKRDTGGNEKTRGIRGSKSLSTDDRIGVQSNLTNESVDRRKSFLGVTAKRSSRWLLNHTSGRKAVEADQDDRSQSSSVSSSSSSSVLMSQAKEEDLLEKYSRARNVTPAPLAPDETATKRKSLSTKESVKWRSTRFFSGL